MLGSLGRVGGRGGSGAGPVFGARLIQPGAIAGGGIVSFSRSQVSSVSTATNSAGNFVQYSADVPRFNGAAQRLLLEGQRTNVLTNPRFEGGTVGVIGSGGVYPTGMSFTGAGFTQEILSFGLWNGAPSMVLRINSLSVISNPVLNFPGSFSPPAGNYAVSSGYIWASGGTLANIATSFWGNAGGGSSVATVPQITTSPNRLIAERLSTGGLRTNGFRLNCSNGTIVDVTLTIAMPQMEDAGLSILPSSPIFPLVGLPAASTRGQDNFTSSFSSLFPTGVGTILASFMIPQNAPSGTDQMLFDISDGSLNNRIRLRNVAGGASIVAGQVIDNTPTDATSLGNMTAGTLFRVGLTFNGTTITGNLNGGTNQTVAGQPTGLTTLRVGNNSSGLAAIFGECGYFDALPNVISAANLPAAVSAIPS
jgi:hypothetical protein